MNDIHLFLAHAIRLEAEAARRYEELAAAMKTWGNSEVEAFFARMAHNSRQHLAEAQARAGFRAVPAMALEDFQWPEGTNPETAAWTGVDGFMDTAMALRLAFDSEQRGRAFYATIAATSRNPRVQVMAEEFATEEGEHVAELRKLAGRYGVTVAE